MTPPNSSFFEYDWLADEPSGTAIVFTMIDSQGKQGGSSDVRIVGNSTDFSCLPGHSKGGGLSSGAIAGIVIIIAFLVFAAIFVYLRRRRRRMFNYYSIDLDGSNDRHSPNGGLPQEYQTTPFILPTEPDSPPVQPSSKRISTSTLNTQTSPVSSTSSNTPGRLIVHRDITEDEEGQVIELPPSYSARRAPIPGITPPPQDPSASSSTTPIPIAEKSRRRRPG
jgi:hypothetical protein